MSPPVLIQPEFRTVEGRVSVICSRCSQSHASLGVSLKRCASCRSVAYCSGDCQRAHWTTEHKRVCKKRSRGLDKVMVQGPYGRNFVVECERWERNHMSMVSAISQCLLRMQASERSLAAKDLAESSALFLTLQYTAEKRPPCKLLDFSGLVLYGEEMRRRYPLVADTLAGLRAQKADAVLSAPECTLFYVCIEVNEMVRIVPLGVLLSDLLGPSSSDDALKVATLLSLLMDGEAGAGPSGATAVAKPLVENAVPRGTKVGLDVCRWVELCEKDTTIFTGFVCSALQLYCGPEHCLLKSHRVVIDADYWSESGSLRAKNYTVMKLADVFTLLQASSRLDPEGQVNLEASESHPDLIASRFQYPTNELFSVVFRLTDRRAHRVTHSVYPRLIPMLSESTRTRRGPALCKYQADVLFEIMSTI